MSTIEVYRDWCELVMDAYNDHGGEVLSKFLPNTPTENAADVIKELISQKKVLSLANYLKSRRDDLPLKDCKTCRKLETESCHTCIQNDHYSNRWEEKK